MNILQMLVSTEITNLIRKTGADVLKIATKFDVNPQIVMEVYYASLGEVLSKMREDEESDG